MSLALAPFIYPYQRLLLETQADNIFKTDKHISNFKESLSRVHASKSYFRGFIRGLISPCFASVLVDPKKYASYFIAGPIIYYPWVVSSYYKALNLTQPINGVKEIYTNKLMWRGFSLWVAETILLGIPILNYFFNPLHQTRLAYALGPANGLDFSSYKQAYRHVRDNGSFKRGRGLINIPLTVYNLYAIHFIKNHKTNYERLGLDEVHKIKEGKSDEIKK
jgi:hypothetical protein